MPPTSACAYVGPPSSEGTEAICRVPSGYFSQAPWYTLPDHLCRFRVRSNVRVISRNNFPARNNPISPNKLRHSSLLTGPGIFYLVPIDYAFRPRLRDRLTLRGLTLRRNPWTFGDSVFHTVFRYSCQHSHFRYLQGLSRDPFAGLRNAPLPRTPPAGGMHPQLRCMTLAPLHLRRGTACLDQ